MNIIAVLTRIFNHSQVSIEKAKIISEIISDLFKIVLSLLIIVR